MARAPVEFQCSACTWYNYPKRKLDCTGAYRRGEEESTRGTV